MLMSTCCGHVVQVLFIPSLCGVDVHIVLNNAFCGVYNVIKFVCEKLAKGLLFWRLECVLWEQNTLPTSGEK